MDHEDESSSGNAGHQNLNDLHNYLTTFNKEIEPVEDVLSTIGVDTGVGDVGDLYASSGGHSLQDAGEVTVAGQFSSGFYSEQGILDNPLSDEGGQSIHGLGAVSDQDVVEDLASSIKQEVGTMELDAVQEQLGGFREHVNLADTLQNQGLIMTSLGEGLDPTGGKVIRIVSLGEDGQYLTLGDGSQMQILSQDLTLNTATTSDTSYVIQGTETASTASFPTRARSILSMPANSHLGLSGKSSATTTSLLTSVSGSSGSSNPSSHSQVSGVAQLVALQSGDGDLQSQLVALPPGTPLTFSAEGLQQYGVLTADGTSSTSELGYQTISVLPTELNQDGMNYVLVMTPQEGDDKQSVAQLVDLKQESQEIREELMEVNGEVRRVLHMVPKKLYPSPSVSGGVNMGAQLMCDYCDYTSSKRYLLTRHMKSHSDERPHKCHECHRGFKTPASLINHVNTHTGTRPHKCKTCDAAFTTSGELVRHIRYRHTFEKPHRCPSCDYASVELSKLKRHMRSHTGERPYKCPHCRYASPDTYKLKRHLRIHTGEKPYKCDICHARFTQSNSLKAHKLIHSGNKPVFQCTLCPTTCGRKTDLKIHFNKLHSIGSPLECKKCGQILADRYSFKQHMRTHDMDKCFKCDQCDFIANTECSLDQHAAIHSQGKKYECSLCHMTFNLQQSLEKHSLSCSLDPGYVNELKEKKNDLDKSSEEELNLLKSEENKDPILPSTSQEESRNQSSTNKSLTGLGQDMFPTPVIASDTLHKNLMQDIKAGKLGDVPQVVIVHPDGTLEEIPASSGEKLNLDDIFSALSNTEKQEMMSHSETVQRHSGQENTRNSLSQKSNDQAKTKERVDKNENSSETVQCEASTQAELESDSESLDDSKDLDSPPSKRVCHVQINDTNMQKTKEAEPETDESLNAEGSYDNVKETVENSSSLMMKEGDLSLQHLKASLSLSTQALQSDPVVQLSPTTFAENITCVKSDGSVSTSSSGSSSTPQYVVVKGYTCLSEDGNTVQPTLVNVAVDKDSLMKMFASLGPAGDGMGLQLLSGDLESSSDTGEEHGERIAQASIIPLHDMADLTAIGEPHPGITDDANSNQLEIENQESPSNRDSGLVELCDFGAEQSEVLSSKDSGFDSTPTFELGESSHSTSSVLSSKNGNSSHDKGSMHKNSIVSHSRSPEGEQSLIEGNQAVHSSFSHNEESVEDMSFVSKEEAKNKNCLMVKHLPSSQSSAISYKTLSLTDISGKASRKSSSKAAALTDQNVNSPPCEITENAPEVKISLSEDSLSVTVDEPPMFHISDERSLSIQPRFSDAPLGDLFTDSFVEDSSNSQPELAITNNSVESKEDIEINVCVKTEQTMDSGQSSMAKGDGDCDSNLKKKEQGPEKPTPKQKGPSKRRASSSPAVDSTLVRTGKRVRKALVKVSM